jgi:hypothetical protein
MVNAVAKRRQRIKPQSRSTRFKKLRGLKCYPEVYTRICDGWALAEVARFVQEERKEYDEISRGGLEQMLAEFRKEIPAGDLVKKRFPEVYDAAKAKVEEGIDEVAELEALYRIQMHRIGMDFATEKKIGKALPSMTSEIKEARSLLETLANLKMELGLADRAPTRHEHDVSVGVEVEATLGEDLSARFGSEAVKEVLANPESRRRVQGVVERFLKLAPPKVESKAEAG